MSKFSCVVTCRKPENPNFKYSGVCPRSADWEDSRNASPEGVQSEASQRLRGYIFVKDIFLFALCLMEAFKMLHGKRRSSTTQVTGSRLFQWKGTLKEAMSKNYKHV